MKKVFRFVMGGLLMMFFLAGCSIQSTGGFDLNKEDCSRKNIQALTSNEFSGFGYADDTITALKFVYENEELNKKYGDKFDVDAAIRTIGTSTRFIPRTSLYKGKTICYLSIAGDQWVVIVEKSYRGKWEVVDYHPYSDADGE